MPKVFLIALLFVCFAGSRRAGATVDGGFNTVVMGFIGAEERYAAVRLEFVHGAFELEPAVIVVDMQRPGGAVVFHAVLDGEAAHARIGSAATEQAWLNFALEQVSAAERARFAGDLVPARSIPTGWLRRVGTTRSAEEFRLASGARLVAAKLPSALRVGRSGTECIADATSPIPCSACKRVDERKLLLDALSPSSVSALGGRNFPYWVGSRLLRGTDPYFACRGTGTTNTGAACDCEVQASFVVPEVRVYGHVFRGVPFLQDMRSERFQISPAEIFLDQANPEQPHSGVRFAMNARGDVLVYGEYTAEPGHRLVSSRRLRTEALPCSDEAGAVR